jgi:hypothetical protein
MNSFEQGVNQLAESQQFFWEDRVIGALQEVWGLIDDIMVGDAWDHVSDKLSKVEKVRKVVHDVVTKMEMDKISSDLEALQLYRELPPGHQVSLLNRAIPSEWFDYD